MNFDLCIQLALFFSNFKCMLSTLAYNFLFVILQLLGCHGPLANREPGRAFLDTATGS